MLEIGTRVRCVRTDHCWIFGKIIRIDGDIYEILDNSDGTTIIWCDRSDFEVVYSPETHGAIEAIRIFMDESGITPMAELAFAYGGTATICWVNTYEREIYKDGINGYTYIYDERPKREFSGWVKSKSLQEELK